MTRPRKINKYRLASARRWRWLAQMARSAHARHVRPAAESAASTVHSPLISTFD